MLADADGKKMKALVIFTEAIKYVKVRLCDIHIPSDKITVVSVCMSWVEIAEIYTISFTHS